MPAFNSKVQICNLANGTLGLRVGINNIDTPVSDKEIVYAQWYDIVRQYMLKLLMPNFALNRAVLSPGTVPTAYADFYAFAYEKPVNCLRVLGFGAADNDDEKPTVEGNTIYTNVDYGSAPSLRFVSDLEDVTLMTADFIISFATVLGKCTALQNTQDPGKKAALLKEAAAEFANSTAQNAMENKPVRHSYSRFRAARFGNPGYNRRKS